MIYKKSLTPTRVIDTCLRAVDVSDYELLFDHPIVLQLMEKSQLSFGDRVFPGGRHSRYEHSVFIYHFTDEVVKHLLRKGCISKQQATDVKIASILHDIGHGPFSHSIGNVLGYWENPKKPETHNDRSVELLNSEEKDSFGRTIKDLILLYSGNFHKVVDVVAKKAPESSVISHHTLGTDKMGYTLVDCHHTGYLIDKPFFLDMFPFIFYNDGEIGISEEKISQVMRLQNLIQEMFTNVYLNEKVMQFRRFVEKAVELEINSGKLTPKQIWGMSEDALTYQLKNSENEDVRKLLRKYSGNELFETSMEFKIEKNERGHATEKKKEIQEFISRDVSNAFVKKYSNPLNLTRLERKIADVADIPFVNLLATLSADPKRVMPEDTAIYTQLGQKIGMLFEMNPGHYHGLVEKAEDFFALRVNVSNVFSKGFLPKSKYVKEIVEDDVKEV